MTPTLAIADRLYSSWSLRGWLLFEAFSIPVTTRHAQMRTSAFTAMLADFGAARTVPALRTADAVLWDSVAILETLAESHPDAGHWPAAPGPRGLARTLVAEMHSGFSALRGAMPMNLRCAYAQVDIAEDVMADVARLTGLWSLARDTAQAPGPWLFGSYCAADAFFAPVAARLATYNVPLGDVDAAYVAAHLAHLPFRRWRAMGLAEGTRQERYEFGHPERPWPGPAPRRAHAVEEAPPARPINAACPYSGRPVVADSLAQIDGRLIGFCNRFCRDKSVADADAWPKLAPLLA